MLSRGVGDFHLLDSRVSSPCERVVDLCPLSLHLRTFCVLFFFVLGLRPEPSALGLGLIFLPENGFGVRRCVLARDVAVPPRRISSGVSGKPAVS